MRVFDSGLPPSGADALPPNRDVMRRMNVLLPHPESAASPMITGPSRPARVTIVLRDAFACTGAFADTTREPAMDLRAASGCAHTADMVMAAIFGVCL
jgi:hypothetical protein